MVKISREHMGQATRFAVAAELYRRNIHAQLTIDKRKRTDLLVRDQQGILRIQAKAKQGGSWASSRGISGRNVVLVLVDFAGKQENERPDFYILTSEDWLNLVNETCRDRISTGEIVIGNDSIPVWAKRVNKNGQPYRGIRISVSQVSAHKERWDKIFDIINSGLTPEPEPVLTPRHEPIPEPEPALAPRHEPTPEFKAGPTPDIIGLTAEELNAAYKADKVAADIRLANKTLSVTGVVDRRVHDDILGYPYIILTSDKEKLTWNTLCFFDIDNGPRLNQLQTGQRVTVRGKYDGYMLNIIMRDCALVD